MHTQIIILQRDIKEIQRDSEKHNNSGGSNCHAMSGLPQKSPGHVIYNNFELLTEQGSLYDTNPNNALFCGEILQTVPYICIN